MDVLGLWQTRTTVCSPLRLQILETSCFSLMKIWLLLATRSRKQQQLDSILFEGLLQRRIYVHNHTKQTTTASKVYRFHGLPGPKSGLRAPIILAQATVLTEGVNFSPLSAGGEGLCKARSRQQAREASGRHPTTTRVILLPLLCIYWVLLSVHAPAVGALGQEVQTMEIQVQGSSFYEETVP